MRIFVAWIVVVSLLAACEGLPTAEDDKDSDSSSDEEEGSEQVEQSGTGTLVISTDEVGAGIQLASDNTAKVSDSFVPASMASSQAGELQVEVALNLQGSPQYCQENPTAEMCVACSPGGAQENSQACGDFFCPGGEGYTEGEATCGPSGGGGGGDPGPGSEGGGGGKGPCEGMEFLECQPTLVKLYMGMGQMAVEQVGFVLGEIKKMAKHAKFEKGVLKNKGDGEEIHYDIRAKDDMQFSIRKLATGEPIDYMRIRPNQYDFEFGLRDEAGIQTISLDFTDDNNWTVDVTMYMDECDPEDVRRPSRIKILMSKVKAVWQGKAMMYNPLWRVEDQEGCDTQSTSETDISIYTDFVGEDAYSTASLYMMSSSVETLNATNIDGFGIDNLCDNFDDFCPTTDGTGNGQSVFGEVPTNPFCSPEEGDVTWGNACASATEEAVQTGDYLSHDLWATPAVLKQPTPKVTKDLAE